METMFVLIMLMLGEEKEPYKREFKMYEIVGVYEDSKSCSERLDKIELDFKKNEELYILQRRKWKQDKYIVIDKKYGNATFYECWKHWMYTN